MRRPPPDRLDEWMDLGHEIISRARDEHDLHHVEAWAELLSIEARVERLGRFSPSTQCGERNLPPAIAAGRLGISVRKLTRERFTTYRDICIPIEGQSRGYVVNERALDALLVRQRTRR
jgi:hypothetical protein